MITILSPVRNSPKRSGHDVIPIAIMKEMNPTIDNVVTGFSLIFVSINTAPSKKHFDD
jgi:hypothetical protein